MRAAATFPTTTPAETIGRAVEFFEREATVEALVVGSFGPVDLDRDSPTWGFITTTPKPGWAQTDVGGELRRRLGVPVAFDTDVNAAALGEHRWGAGRELGTFCYVTVGTGIGGGAIVGGKLLHGLAHPELGHIRIPHDREADPFPGSCPYHGDCWEGLASGPALEARHGRPAPELDDEAAWALEARYLALGLVAVIGVLSPGADPARRRRDGSAWAARARPRRGRGAAASLRRGPGAHAAGARSTRRRARRARPRRVRPLATPSGSIRPCRPDCSRPTRH